MIMHFGFTEYTQHKEKLVHYRFFDDPIGNGEDAIFGLDRYLMTLVNIFKSAARRYGTERRIILLHGPVGSSKSTIVRLLKKGLEYYTRLPEGALYSFSWVLEDGTVVPCPLNEEPLKLIPPKCGCIFWNGSTRARQKRSKFGWRETFAPCAASTSASSCESIKVTGNKSWTNTSASAASSSAKKTHRHRDFPAQRRKEPRQHRIDRRH
jgi:hypothetical protein